MDQPLTIREIIQQASDDDLLDGLARRGARTRPLRNGRTQIVVTVDLRKSEKVARKPRRTKRPKSSVHPDAVLNAANHAHD